MAITLAIRRIRGDGNCLYRGFHTSWTEWLLRYPTDQEYVWKQLVPRVSERLKPNLPEPMATQLIELGRGFAGRLQRLCEATDSLEVCFLGTLPCEACCSHCTPPPKSTSA